MVALMWHGWRAEGLYWIGEMGERRGKEEVFLLFFFFQGWLGVGAME